MVLLEISVSLVLLAGIGTLAVIAWRVLSRPKPSHEDDHDASAIPDELLEAEHTVTRQLFNGGIVRSEFRHAMAELARQSSGSRRVT